MCAYANKGEKFSDRIRGRIVWFLREPKTCCAQGFESAYMWWELHVWGGNAFQGELLLVPSGVSILCQIHGSYSSRGMTFVFGLTSFGAQDFGGFPSSLWWIQTAFISARSLGFTSSLELTFLHFWENPILAREFIDSPKPWSDSSIPLVGMFTRSLWSCLQNLVRFGLVLILQSSSLGSNREQK